MTLFYSIKQKVPFTFLTKCNPEDNIQKKLKINKTSFIFLLLLRRKKNLKVQKYIISNISLNSNLLEIKIKSKKQNKTKNLKILHFVFLKNDMIILTYIPHFSYFFTREPSMVHQITNSYLYISKSIIYKTNTNPSNTITNLFESTDQLFPHSNPNQNQRCYYAKIFFVFNQ